MNQNPVPLTDLDLLAKRRAKIDPSSDALFMHHIAMAEIEERLETVNRTFTSPAIVTFIPTIWSKLAPGAHIITPQETLSLDPGAHDLVIHALSLHWSNDPVGQLIQCRRALRPDGLFLGCLFGGQTLHELRKALTAAEIEQTGGISPRVAPMSEVRDIGGLLQRAGFGLPVADVSRQDVSYRNLASLARDLRAMGENNSLAARIRTPSPNNLFKNAERHYRAAGIGEDEKLHATFEVIHIAGWAPHPDQQQPLKPGSASHSLAEVLDHSLQKD